MSEFVWGQGRSKGADGESEGREPELEKRDWVEGLMSSPSFKELGTDTVYLWPLQRVSKQEKGIMEQGMPSLKKRLYKSFPAMGGLSCAVMQATFLKASQQRMEVSLSEMHLEEFVHRLDPDWAGRLLVLPTLWCNEYHSGCSISHLG